MGIFCYFCNHFMEEYLQKHRRLIATGLVVLAVGVYAVLSIGNHLAFRTYGLDLGLYTHALYDYAHLRSSDGSFFLWQPSNLLADHFDLYLVLLSPLVYLLGNWTLLVVQLCALGVGMAGMYRLASTLDGRAWFALTAMVLLPVGFGVWHAYSFDYHSNVVAAMLLPWLVVATRQKRVWATAVLAALMAVAKETSALWVVAVLAGLMFDCRRDRRMLRTLGLTAAGCVVWFLLTTMVVMPALGSTSQGFRRYEWMGASMGQVAVWLLTHPLEALRDVFVDFTPAHDSGVLKREFFVCILASGMLLAAFKPNYLIMTIPPLAMKMLSSHAENLWGVAFHYNVELGVVAAVGAVVVLARMKSTRWRAATAGAAVVLSALTLGYTVHEPHTRIRIGNVRIMDSRHYRQPDFDSAAARRMLGSIPADASVCATTMFTPHLAARDKVYIFPMGQAYDAEYYLLVRKHWCYYDDEEAQVARLAADSSRFDIVDTAYNLVLLHRR